MPFKGDRRLGGRRRNDSTLNGMTEGPDFPVAGTVLGISYGLVYEAGASTSYGLWYEGNWVEGSDYTQIADFNVVADGIGGSGLDYQNPLNIRYKPSGTVILNSVASGPGYTELTISTGIISVENGVITYGFGHDGYGGVGQFAQSRTYQPDGFLLFTDNTQVTQLYNDVSYQVGTLEVYYSSNGAGEYTTASGSISYYAPGTQVGSLSGTYYVEIPGYGNYPSGSYTNYLIWNGYYSGISEIGGSYSYETYGNLILQTGDPGYRYYHNGSGGYYEEYYDSSSGGGGGCPSQGTESSSSSGDNYTWISQTGRNVLNGTYTQTTYHDGNCGYYTSDGYSYASQDTILDYGSPLSYEQAYLSELALQYSTGRYYPYLYRSDGNGSYYEDNTNSSVVYGDYYQYGQTIYSDFSANQQYISEANVYAPNGTENASVHYVHDGAGGYAQGPLTNGSYYAYGAPVYDMYGYYVNWTDGDGNTVQAYWDGNGGYYTGA